MPNCAEWADLMSAGRKALSLEALQAAIQAGDGKRVYQALLGVPVVERRAARPERPSAVQPEPTRIGRRVSGEWWERAKPTDWPWRMTDEDIADEAAELARDRLPLPLALLVDAVVYGPAVPMSAHERSQVEAMIRKCRLDVIRSAPKEPPRRKPRKPPRMTPRTRAEGPASSVVTTTRDGRVLVNGVEVWCELPEDREICEA